jgi:hypothetical protein
MRRRKLFVVLAVVLALVAMGALVLWHNELDDLPQPEQVEAMQVTVYEPLPPGGKQTWHEISPEHFPFILAAMRPCRRDPQPAKWKVFGEADLTLKGGRHFGIWLYSTSTGPGAFSAGRAFNTRVYYRGGTDEGIKATIRAACQ